jgi:hypothetical protein
MNSRATQHILHGAGRSIFGFLWLVFLPGALQSASLEQSTVGCGLDTWSTREAVVTVWLRDVIYDASGGFVAVGDSGVLLSSPDGKRWLARYQPLSIAFSRVRHANGVYYAMGQQFGSVLNTWSAVLWSSPDGVTWTPRYNAEASAVNGLAAGNGGLVAVLVENVTGGGAISRSLISQDGLGWNPGGTITERRMYDIAYGNGTFVAVGGNRIVASADGVNWTAAAVPLGLSLQAITFFQDQFIVVGEGGAILTSPDGSSWTTRSSGTTTFLGAITVGNDQVAVAGNSGTVLTSQNGIDWARRLDAGLDLRGIAFGVDTFVAVGRYGTVYQSGALIGCGGPRLRVTREMLALTGTVGARYRIEYANSLDNNWNLLQEFTLAESPWEVMDPIPSPTGQRFYRAVRLP